jgi:hypothetical protein
LICWNGINAESLCGHKSINGLSGTKMVAGCDNGQLKSITIRGEDDWPDWIFIIEAVKSEDGGKYDFISSEAYRVTFGMKYAALDPKFVENNTVLTVDTMFFQKGRTAFLRIRKSPRDTTFQLKEPLMVKKHNDSRYLVVELYKNIKIARMQKTDLFTDDSINVPDILISRGGGLTGIVFTKITNFHAGLIDKEFTVQFDAGPMAGESDWGYPKRHQYKFRIP